MKNPAKTVCARCRFHKKVIANDRCPDAWYNHRCSHEGVVIEGYQDPVTGKNVGDEMPYCRDINRGNCGFYSEKIF